MFELTISKEKSGEPRRILVPRAAAKLFAAQTKSKLPGTPLLGRANGQRWDKETWKRPIAAAVIEAKLPIGATAYALRHSTITDLLNGGLLLLTVGKIGIRAPK